MTEKWYNFQWFALNLENSIRNQFTHPIDENVWRCLYSWREFAIYVGSLRGTGIRCRVEVTLRKHLHIHSWIIVLTVQEITARLRSNVIECRRIVTNPRKLPFQVHGFGFYLVCIYTVTRWNSTTRSFINILTECVHKHTHTYTYPLASWSIFKIIYDIGCFFSISCSITWECNHYPFDEFHVMMIYCHYNILRKIQGTF